MCACLCVGCKLPHSRWDSRQQPTDGPQPNHTEHAGHPWEEDEDSGGKRIERTGGAEKEEREGRRREEEEMDEKTRMEEGRDM